MRIGIPKEIKTHEYRVAATPSCVAAYVKAGHRVLVERGAGQGAGYRDEQYLQAGATLADGPNEVFADSQMMVKVKEPLPPEYPLFRSGQILYTYLHLAADRDATCALLDAGVSAVAYETIQLEDGSLPLLIPMSEIAGRLSVQEGAKYLEKPFGGRGVLLGGVPGVARGDVAIVGGGVVGTNAAKMAVGLGARVTMLDTSHARLRQLDDLFGVAVQTLLSTEANLQRALAQADLVVGAVLVPGAAAPKLLKRVDLAHMKEGALLVDVSVDQGGMAETTRPTTHREPTFEVDGVLHYCVANMPGAVPRTSTQALTGTTLSYGLQLANLGLEQALAANPALRRGLNTRDGKITCQPVAEALGMTAQLAEI
ncbi:MAG: alanine dehydrogenase [Proteobacteria bacterium]|nr:alanine dehydrogenase [Pseudomonadota bacterium]